MATEHVDMTSLAELKEIMEDDFVMLIETYLGDADARMASIRDAVVGGDAEKFRQSTHSFKGSCSNIGAKILTEILADAEAMGNNNEMAKAQKMVVEIEQEYVLVKDILSQQIN